ncbi:hypothetical protein [Cupriavidus pinatubonensis]|nr:hypothetical protein [Cupriavidus pinatubonensis]
MQKQKAAVAGGFLFATHNPDENKNHTHSRLHAIDVAITVAFWRVA